MKCLCSVWFFLLVVCVDYEKRAIAIHTGPPNSTNASTTRPPPSPVPTSPQTTKRATTAEKTTTSRLKPTLKPTAKTQELPNCKEDEIKYQYTECGAQGGRWKVGIPPDSHSCTLKNPPAPEWQKKCKISCDTGQYFNIKMQKCLPCKAGTYSLNGGIRITSWPTLPSGFETWGKEKDDFSVDLSGKENVCQDYKWQAKGQYVESAGDYCSSVLMYSATLIQGGNVSFTFKAGSETAYFHVKVINNWCSTTMKGTHHYYPNVETKWKTNYIPLKQGKNAIFFEAAYIYDTEMTDTGTSFSTSEDEDGKKSVSNHKYDQSSKYSIQIREIEITGLSYTSECTPCPPGTYSPEGSAVCKDCRRDTYSKGSEATCTKCNDDEYAGLGWEMCKKRPACKERDYYEDWSPCGKDDMITKTFKWIQPQICNPDLPDSVKLTSDVQKMKCPPCNPGQYKNGTECVFCPDGTFSDGIKDKCTPCPVLTTPRPGLFFTSWQSANLSLLHPYCLSSQERSCMINQGWSVKENHLSSGIGHADDAELVLYVEIPAFTAEKSELTLDFKQVCTKGCRLSLEEYSHLRGLLPVMRWDGNRERTKYTYKITGRDFKRFKLTFEKPYVSDKQTFVYSMDRVEIYAFNITNAKNGGADRCIGCAVGTSQKSCIHCLPGQYLDEDKKKCVTCPENTYWSIKSDGTARCLPCPDGSTSKRGSPHCHSDCVVQSPDGRKYDLTPLAGNLDMKSEKQFTSRAFPYFHRFNVSICGTPLGSTCVGIQKNKDSSGNEMAVTVMADVCRSYCYSEGNGKLCAQAMSLGDHLEFIHVGDPFNGTKLAGHPDQADEVNDTLPSDVNFFFTSNTITPRCPNGFSTLITLRCDLSARDKGFLRPPKQCSHGTCNGCLYHLYWHSLFSCPVCTSVDYRNITSACADGKSTTHHIWNFPKMCRDGVTLPEDTSRNCSIFEKSILDFQVFIMIFLGLAILLLCTVLILCYRNRKLSYKYHRLIDATAVSDGELPAAEKCTLEEGEEDEEEVVLSRNGRTGRRILDRIKKSIGSPMARDDFNEFETINLTEHGSRMEDDH